MRVSFDVFFNEKPNEDEDTDSITREKKPRNPNETVKTHERNNDQPNANDHDIKAPNDDVENQGSNTKDNEDKEKLDPDQISKYNKDTPSEHGRDNTGVEDKTNIEGSKIKPNEHENNDEEFDEEEYDDVEHVPVKRVRKVPRKKTLKKEDNNTNKRNKVNLNNGNGSPKQTSEGNMETPNENKTPEVIDTPLDPKNINQNKIDGSDEPNGNNEFEIDPVTKERKPRNPMNKSNTNPEKDSEPNGSHDTDDNITEKTPSQTDDGQKSNNHAINPKSKASGIIGGLVFEDEDEDDESDPKRPKKSKKRANSKSGKRKNSNKISNDQNEKPKDENNGVVASQNIPKDLTNDNNGMPKDKTKNRRTEEPTPPDYEQVDKDGKPTADVDKVVDKIIDKYENKDEPTNSKLMDIDPTKDTPKEIYCQGYTWAKMLEDHEPSLKYSIKRASTKIKNTRTKVTIIVATMIKHLNRYLNPTKKMLEYAVTSVINELSDTLKRLYDTLKLHVVTDAGYFFNIFKDSVGEARDLGSPLLPKLNEIYHTDTVFNSALLKDTKNIIFNPTEDHTAFLNEIVDSFSVAPDSTEENSPDLNEKQRTLLTLEKLLQAALEHVKDIDCTLLTLYNELRNGVIAVERINKQLKQGNNPSLDEKDEEKLRKAKELFNLLYDRKNKGKKKKAKKLENPFEDMPPGDDKTKPYTKKNKEEPSSNKPSSIIEKEVVPSKTSNPVSEGTPEDNASDLENAKRENKEKHTPDDNSDVDKIKREGELGRTPNKKDDLMTPEPKGTQPLESKEQPSNSEPDGLDLNKKPLVTTEPMNNEPDEPQDYDDFDNLNLEKYMNQPDDDDVNEDQSQKLRNGNSENPSDEINHDDKIVDNDKENKNKASKNNSSDNDTEKPNGMDNEKQSENKRDHSPDSSEPPGKTLTEPSIKPSSESLLEPSEKTTSPKNSVNKGSILPNGDTSIPENENELKSETENKEAEIQKLEPDRSGMPGDAKIIRMKSKPRKKKVSKRPSERDTTEIEPSSVQNKPRKPNMESEYGADDDMNSNTASKNPMKQKPLPRKIEEDKENPIEMETNNKPNGMKSKTNGMKYAPKAPRRKATKKSATDHDYVKKEPTEDTNQIASTFPKIKTNNPTNNNNEDDLTHEDDNNSHMEPNDKRKINTNYEDDDHNQVQKPNTLKIKTNGPRRQSRRKTKIPNDDEDNMVNIDPRLDEGSNSKKNMRPKIIRNGPKRRQTKIPRHPSEPKMNIPKHNGRNIEDSDHDDSNKDSNNEKNIKPKGPKQTPRKRPGNQSERKLNRPQDNEVNSQAIDHIDDSDEGPNLSKKVKPNGQKKGPRRIQVNNKRSPSSKKEINSKELDHIGDKDEGPNQENKIKPRSVQNEPNGQRKRPNRPRNPSKRTPKNPKDNQANSKEINPIDDSNEEPTDANKMKPNGVQNASNKVPKRRQSSSRRTNFPIKKGTQTQGVKNPRSSNKNENVQDINNQEPQTSDLEGDRESTPTNKNLPRRNSPRKPTGRSQTTRNPITEEKKPMKQLKTNEKPNEVEEIDPMTSYEIRTSIILYLCGTNNCNESKPILFQTENRSVVHRFITVKKGSKSVSEKLISNSR
uniref:Uncharacterized protein n=1 Tax=Cacopsylla melanoneura TaxID=428564 RepID=A0A8D8RTW3_9HEMI